MAGAAGGRAAAHDYALLLECGPCGAYVWAGRSGDGCGGEAYGRDDWGVAGEDQGFGAACRPDCGVGPWDDGVQGQEVRGSGLDGGFEGGVVGGGSSVSEDRRGKGEDLRGVEGEG